MATSHCTYRRPDGVVGVGFEIEFAGRRQHSVAWPDGPARRYTAEELGRHKIACDGIEQVESHQTPPVDTSGEEEALVSAAVAEAEGDAAEASAEVDGGDAGHTNTPVLMEVFAESNRAEGSDSPVLDDRTIKMLADQGIHTVDEARAYLDEHGSFVPLTGIGKVTDGEIRACLDHLAAE